MLDALLDAVFDSLKILPFLFVTYLIMEYLESHTEDRVRDLVKRAGWMGPSGAGFWVPSRNAVFLRLRPISTRDGRSLSGR